MIAHKAEGAETIASFDYGSCFIDSRGTILWEVLKAACPTAHRAALILSDENLGTWDRREPDRINAILFENGIDPTQIDVLRDDVVAVAHRAVWQIYRREKFRRDGVKL